MDTKDDELCEEYELSTYGYLKEILNISYMGALLKYDILRNQQSEYLKYPQEIIGRKLTNAYFDNKNQMLYIIQLKEEGELGDEILYDLIIST